MPFNLAINKENLQLEEFYTTGPLGWVQAYQDCQTKGFKQLTMPEQIEARIAAPDDSPLWQKWNDTISMKLTGRTRSSNVSRNGGTPVVAFYHGPLQISLKYIQQQIQENQLVHGALRITLKQFDAMLQQCSPENVIDYQTLKSSRSGKVSLTAALDHPQTVPFIGSRERAETYLSRFAQVYNTEEIGISHYDDLSNYQSSLMRPLCLGYDYYIGLAADNGFESAGRFFGVRALQNSSSQETTIENSQQSSNSQPRIIQPPRLLISGRELTLEERTILEKVEKGEGFQYKGYTYLPAIRKRR